MSTEDEIALAGVQAEMATGRARIGAQATLVDWAVLNRDAACRERIDLWDLELTQARLNDLQGAILERVAAASAPLAVLIVEDEMLVMMTVSDYLTDAGFAVTEASNADRAIERLEADDSIGAMFTDVQMAGSMNGLELVRVVHQRWPGIRVLVTSGDASFGLADLRAGDRFFRKPYLLEDVATALRAA
jgi:CheY-like chemotaxis protein